MAELADAQDLGSCTARCVGSTPTVRIRASRSIACKGIASLIAAASVLPGAAAHDFKITDVRVQLSSNQTWQMDLRVDLDALALGVPPSTDSHLIKKELENAPPDVLAEFVERARRTLLTRVKVRIDDVDVEPELSFPEHGAPPNPDAELPTLLGLTARFKGTLPPGAREFAARFSRAFGPVHLNLVDHPRGFTNSYALEPGAQMPPHSLRGGAGADFDPTSPTLHSLRTAWQYFKLGFQHILPKGVDHILFVLGLFLLSTRWQTLLAQITAFTVAHTITLALSMCGVMTLGSRFVESMIALSIAYVGIENLVTSRLHSWRVGLVFGFGLLHGLGFAGVLSELGQPRGQFAPALVGFNVGVEAGQIAVVGLAFSTVGWFRHSRRYRSWVVAPSSGLIAVLGLWWAAARGLA